MEGLNAGATCEVDDGERERHKKCEARDKLEKLYEVLVHCLQNITPRGYPF